MMEHTTINLGHYGTSKVKSRQVYAGDNDTISFHPLPTRTDSGINNFIQTLTQHTGGRRLLVLIITTVMCAGLLFSWSHVSNSMSMTGLGFMLIFDVLYLLTAAFSLWANTRGRQLYSSYYSFGYSRFEVLCVFSSVMLAQLGSFFIVKESVESLFEPRNVHTGSLPEGAVLSLFVHLIIIYSTENTAFQKVIQACGSSWLQEHVTDISESLCHMIPALSKLLLPRINPLTLLGCASSLAVFCTHIAIDLKNYQGSDMLAAACIALFTIGTMYPLSSYTAKILLQTTPSHMVGQIDKCLREACTLDGVLEFRNEHFWSIGLAQMAGSVHVRVRRDANDQLVLAHVYHRLSAHVPNLTIQIFKDDWSRPSAYQIINQGQHITPLSQHYTQPPPKTSQTYSMQHHSHSHSQPKATHTDPIRPPVYQPRAPPMFNLASPSSIPSLNEVGMDQSFVMVPTADKIPAFTSTTFGSPAPQRFKRP